MSSTIYNFAHPVFTLFVREGEDEAKAAEAQAKAAAEAAQKAEVQKQIDAAVAASVSGLKAKNEELLGKMKEANERAKQFEGMDATKMKEMLDRLDKDEDAKLFAEGKSNLVIEKYTVRMREQHKAELTAAIAEKEAQRIRAENYKASVLDNQIRAVTTGLHRGAVDDALLHGRSLFTLDAKGNAVQLDSEGRPVLGKDGSTPFSPAEWIELQKELKPHWFPAGTSGSGSGGASSGAGGTGKTMSRSNFDKLAPAQQVQLMRSGTKLID